MYENLTSSGLMNKYNEELENLQYRFRKRILLHVVTYLIYIYKDENKDVALTHAHRILKARIDHKHHHSEGF